MLLASDTLIHFTHKSRYLRRKVPKVGSIPARSNSKRSETDIIYLSTVEIRRTQHWKWWLCKSSRSHLQQLLGLRNISYGCHSRFLSGSVASEPPIKSYFHITISAWRCLLFSYQMKMSSEENFSRHALRVVSNTAWYKCVYFRGTFFSWVTTFSLCPALARAHFSHRVGSEVLNNNFLD